MCDCNHKRKPTTKKIEKTQSKQIERVQAEIDEIKPILYRLQAEIDRLKPRLDRLQLEIAAEISGSGPDSEYDSGFGASTDCGGRGAF